MNRLSWIMTAAAALAIAASSLGSPTDSALADLSFVPVRQRDDEIVQLCFLRRIHDPIAVG